MPIKRTSGKKGPATAQEGQEPALNLHQEDTNTTNSVCNVKLYELEIKNKKNSEKISFLQTVSKVCDCYLFTSAGDSSAGTQDKQILAFYTRIPVFFNQNN
jgi:hypothetical protein